MTPTAAQDPTDLPDFGMDDDAGDLEVQQLVQQVGGLVDAGEVERREALVALSDGVQAISARHPEVTDIAVRDSILRELKPAFQRAGWDVAEPFEF